MDVIVIGAGRLGRALSEYKLFKERNIHVKALFDIKKKLVGTTARVKGERIPILHSNDLQNYIQEHPHIKIAILTVPEHSAQDILDRGCSGFIQKPFNIRNLSAKINGIMQ